MEKVTNVKEVLDRLKNHLLLGTDKELREYWGITRSRMDYWKKQGEIAKSPLMDLARKEGLNFNWIVKGEGPKYKISQTPEPQLLNKELSKEIAEHVAESMPTYGKDPRTVKLCTAFDALGDKDKEEVLKEIMPYIIKRF